MASRDVDASVQPDASSWERWAWSALDEVRHAHDAVVRNDATMARYQFEIPESGESVSAESVVRTLLEHEVTALERNDPLARLGRDPEGVHQLRVGARRLRAELSVVAPVLRQREIGSLRGELRWLGEVLSEQRDLDVLSELLRAVSGELARPLDGQVLVALDDQRARETRKVNRALSSKRYRTLVKNLAELAEAPPLRTAASEPARHVLQPGLDFTLGRLFGYVDQCGRDPSNEELHRIRILAKRARYSAEVARSYLGEGANRVAVCLAEVQDVLGHLHDQVVATQYLSSVSTSRTGERVSFAPDEFRDATQWLYDSIWKLKSLWRGPIEEARRESATLADGDGNS